MEGLDRILTVCAGWWLLPRVDLNAVQTPPSSVCKPNLKTLEIPLPRFTQQLTNKTLLASLRDSLRISSNYHYRPPKSFHNSDINNQIPKMTAFDFVQSCKSEINHFRKLYIDMSKATLTEQAVDTMSTQISPDASIVYFWGQTNTQSEWNTSTKHMMKDAPKDPNARSDNIYEKVIFCNDTHCMIEAKDAFHMVGMKLVCVATITFEKAEGKDLRNGVRLLHYQETKVDGECEGMDKMGKEQECPMKEGK